MLNYPAHVCKRFNREMFTIIPLLGDVRCLIPFVGFKNPPWDSRRSSAPGKQANRVSLMQFSKLIPSPQPFRFTTVRMADVLQLHPPFIYPPQTPPPRYQNPTRCSSRTSVYPPHLSVQGLFQQQKLSLHCCWFRVVGGGGGPGLARAPR